ncbi:MAG: hypothetical protein RMM06_09220 [Armatimonadota bacterium]|nr:hypothetical protein [Armatimonadota bacterium]
MCIGYYFRPSKQRCEEYWLSPDGMPSSKCSALMASPLPINRQF